MPVEWQGSVGETIAWLRREGYEVDQAAAVAYRMARDRGVEAKSIEEAIKAAAAAPMRTRTRDYLEAALEHARKALPHSAYAEIYQAARAKAGGRIAARNRMTALEKGLAGGWGSLSKSELSAAAERADELYVADLRRGATDPSTRFLAAAVDDAACVRGLRSRPTVKADRTDDPGVMIAVRLPPNLAAELAIEGGEPVQKLHCTLVYLGRYGEIGGAWAVQRATEIVAEVAGWSRPLKGVICGLGRFAGTEASDGKDVIWASVDVPGLTDLRHEVVERLAAAGIPFKTGHDFTPHVTLAYVDAKAPTPRNLPDATRLRDVFFDEVVVAVADVDVACRIGAPPAVYVEPEPVTFDRVLDATMKGDVLITYPTIAIEVVEVVPEGAIVLEGGVIKTDLPIAAGDLLTIGTSAAFSTQVVPTDPVAREDALELAEKIQKHAAPVPFVGPDGASVVFVAAAPSELEVARGEGFVGPDGVAFAATYLGPLRLTKSQVAIGHVMPVLPLGGIDETEVRTWLPWFFQQMTRFPSAKIVAVGKVAKSILGDRASCVVPHPSVVRLKDSGEVGRKMHALAKSLDGAGALRDGVDVTSPSDGDDAPESNGGDGTGRTDVHHVRVWKAVDEKQIVCGVVLDPYDVDTQNEWVPPAVIEDTAHGFLSRSRVIGIEHVQKAKAELVESFVVPYPSTKDYELAKRNLPHRAYVMPYGSDKVRSGAWVIGVKLGDAEWAAHKRGEINAFSIGGFSFKRKVNRAQMPTVQFLELAPIA